MKIEILENIKRKLGFMTICSFCVLFALEIIYFGSIENSYFANLSANIMIKLFPINMCLLFSTALMIEVVRIKKRNDKYDK